MLAANSFKETHKRNAGETDATLESDVSEINKLCKDLLAKFMPEGGAEFDERVAHEIVRFGGS